MPHPSGHHGTAHRSRESAAHHRPARLSQGETKPDSVESLLSFILIIGVVVVVVIAVLHTAGGR
jgi:hypothetical protein